MGDAARLQINGLDGMRYLGADPSRPADHVEALVTEKLNNRIVLECKRAAADA